MRTISNRTHEISTRDIVTCRGSRIKYKVIDSRGHDSGREVRIQNLDDSKDVKWVYAAICEKDLKSSLNNRRSEADKILNNGKRK